MPRRPKTGREQSKRNTSNTRGATKTKNDDLIFTEKAVKSPRIISPRPTTQQLKNETLSSPVLMNKRESRQATSSPNRLLEKSDASIQKKKEEKPTKRVAFSQSKLRQPAATLKRKETLEPNKTETQKKEELDNIMNKAWAKAEEIKKSKRQPKKGLKEKPLMIETAKVLKTDASEEEELTLTNVQSPVNQALHKHISKTHPKPKH